MPEYRRSGVRFSLHKNVKDDYIGAMIPEVDTDIRLLNKSILMNNLALEQESKALSVRKQRNDIWQQEHNMKMKSELEAAFASEGADFIQNAISIDPDSEDALSDLANLQAGMSNKRLLGDPAVMNVYKMVSGRIEEGNRKRKAKLGQATAVAKSLANEGIKMGLHGQTQEFLSALADQYKPEDVAAMTSDYNDRVLSPHFVEQSAIQTVNVLSQTAEGQELLKQAYEYSGIKKKDLAQDSVGAARQAYDALFVVAGYRNAGEMSDSDKRARAEGVGQWIAGAIKQKKDKKKELFNLDRQDEADKNDFIKSKKNSLSGTIKKWEEAVENKEDDGVELNNIDIQSYKEKIRIYKKWRSQLDILGEAKYTLDETKKWFDGLSAKNSDKRGANNSIIVDEITPEFPKGSTPLRDPSLPQKTSNSTLNPDD